MTLAYFGVLGVRSFLCSLLWEISLAFCNAFRIICCENFYYLLLPDTLPSDHKSQIAPDFIIIHLQG